MRAAQSILFVLFIIVFSVPTFVFANGGDQRVVEGKYLINLSRAPFTPQVGEKTAMLPSFFDLEKNKLIAEDLIVKVRIARLGGAGLEKRTFIFEKDGIVVHGGVLEGLSYIFADTGLHEVFFDFAFASDPQKIYEAPDFLLDIQEQSQSEKSDRTLFFSIMLGLTILGFLLGWVTRSKVK